VGRLVPKEFNEFLNFISSIWGKLTAISIFFPLSNVLMKVIPLGKATPTTLMDQGRLITIYKGNGLETLDPSLFTVVTTLAILFLIFWNFSQRSELKREGDESLKNYAKLNFLIGFPILILYLYIYYKFEASFIDDVILLVLYITFFLLMLNAFIRLAMIEYLLIKDNLHEGVQSSRSRD
jgi:hypothetical protein